MLHELSVQFRSVGEEWSGETTRWAIMTVGSCGSAGAIGGQRAFDLQ